MGVCVSVRVTCAADKNLGDTKGVRCDVHVPQKQPSEISAFAFTLVSILRRGRTVMRT